MADDEALEGLLVLVASPRSCASVRGISSALRHPPTMGRTREAEVHRRPHAMGPAFDPHPGHHGGGTRSAYNHRHVS